MKSPSRYEELPAGAGHEELLGLPAIHRSRIQYIRSPGRRHREFQRIPVDVCSLNQLLRKDFRQLMQESGCLRQVDSDGKDDRDGDRTLTEV